MSEAEAAAGQLAADPADLVNSTLRAAEQAWEEEQCLFERRPNPAPRAGAGRQGCGPRTAATNARLVAAATWSDRVELGRQAVDRVNDSPGQRASAGGAAAEAGGDLEERRREALRIMRAPTQPVVGHR